MSEPETMVFRFRSGQSLRASIEHEAPLYYSLRDTAGNPLVVSRDRVREIVPLAEVEPCPDAFSGAATDPGHSWDGDACTLCGRSRLAEATPAAVPVPDETAGDETGEAERLQAELAELTARARRVAVSHEHFIQDHDDPGTEALAAQYELVNHLSRSADPGDLPLNPVETALRLVLAVLDETQDDASPRELRRTIADALPRDDMSDRRRCIYLDAKGDGWIDQSVTSDGTRWVVPVTASGPAEKADSVAERTGSLREIGRCW